MSWRSNDHKKIVLYWLPVILLPLVNIIIAIATGADYDVGRVLPWVIGAIAEELFFRYFLLRTLLLKRSKLKPEFSICFVAFLFASIHLFNLRIDDSFMVVLMQMIFAFCFSIWAGAVVWRTDKVWIPLIAHVLLNATAVAENNWIGLAVSVAVLIDGILLMKGDQL